jgi:hypothetical protein
MGTDVRVLLLLACKWMPYIERAEHETDHAPVRS